MNKKTLENFWYYHKVKVIVGIFAIIAFVMILKLNHGKLAHDVDIAYVTDGRTISQEAEAYLNQSFAEKIQDVTGDKNKETGFVPLMGPRVDMEFVAEGAQIVLMDGNTLSKFINTGVLEPLDPFVNKCKLDLSGHPEINAEVPGIEGHTYAIPMKFIPLLLGVGFPSEDYYLTVRTANHKNKTSSGKNMNAHAIMETLLALGKGMD